MGQPTAGTDRHDQPRGSAPERPPTPTYWLTGGIATITAALIGLVGTIAAGGADRMVAGTPHPPDPGTSVVPSAGTTSGGGTGGTNTDGGPGPGRYRLLYERVSFDLPFPAAMCEDHAVTFTPDGPDVTTKPAATVRFGYDGVDLYYEYCAEQVLGVPDATHRLAVSSADADVAACARDVRQHLIPKRIALRALRVGGSYCLATAADDLVHLTVTGIADDHDLVLEATMWQQRDPVG